MRFESDEEFCRMDISSDETEPYRGCVQAVTNQFSVVRQVHMYIPREITSRFRCKHINPCRLFNGPKGIVVGHIKESLVVFSDVSVASQFIHRYNLNAEKFLANKDCLFSINSPLVRVLSEGFLAAISPESDLVFRGPYGEDVGRLNVGYIPDQMFFLKNCIANLGGIGVAFILRDQVVILEWSNLIPACNR